MPGIGIDSTSRRKRKKWITIRLRKIGKSQCAEMWSCMCRNRLNHFQIHWNLWILIKFKRHGIAVQDMNQRKLRRFAQSMHQYCAHLEGLANEAVFSLLVCKRPTFHAHSHISAILWFEHRLEHVRLKEKIIEISLTLWRSATSCVRRTLSASNGQLSVRSSVCNFGTQSAEFDANSAENCVFLVFIYTIGWNIGSVFNVYARTCDLILGFK